MTNPEQGNYPDFSSEARRWDTRPARYFLKERSAPVGKDWDKTQLLSLTKQGIIDRDIDSGVGKYPASFEGYQLVEPGNLVFCLFDVEETPRTIGLVKNRGMITSAYTAYQVNESVAYPRFLEYLFVNIDNFKRYRPFYSGLRNTIPKGALLGTKVSLPPLEEQKAIADFLDRELRSIDNLAATQQQLKKLIEERRASLILNGVLGKFLQHDRSSIRDSDWIDSLPSSWQHKRMKYAVAQVKGGVWGQEDNDSEDSIWCVRIADFDRKNLRVNTETQTMRSVTLSERAGRILRRGDLILEKSGGGDQAPVGCVVLYDFDGQAVSSNFTNVLRLRNHQNSRYWTYVNQALYVNGLTWRSIKQTSGIQNLDTENYLNEIVPFPPESDQNVIAEYLDKELAKIDNLQNTIDEFLNLLQERRKALINSAVTGKIDVRGKN